MADIVDPDKEQSDLDLQFLIKLSISVVRIFRETVKEYETNEHLMLICLVFLCCLVCT